MKRVVRRLSQNEIIKLHDVIKSHIKLLPKDRESDAQLVEYEEGWDDQRCAREVADDLSSGHAGTLRQNMFGKLFVKGAADDRIEHLEQEMNELRNRLMDMTVKFDKLVVSLTLNKVVDVRHLKIVP